MKVLINNKIYDSDLIPITVYFDDDKPRAVKFTEVSNGVKMYTAFPEDMNGDEVLAKAIKKII